MRVFYWEVTNWIKIRGVVSKDVRYIGSSKDNVDAFHYHDFSLMVFGMELIGRI